MDEKKKNKGQGGADISRQEFEAQLVDRAARDDAFRDELLKDGRSAIEREFGIQVPEGVTIQVMEESSDTLYLVLPPRATDEGPYELSDNDLETAARRGRTSAWTWCCIITLYG